MMKKFFINKKINKFIKIIEILFFLILVLYLLFIVILKISNTSSIFGYRFFTIDMTTMEPDYLVNDVIVVKDVDISSLRVEQDIVYKGEKGGLEDLFVSHRIVKIEKDNNINRYYTQGINSNVIDPVFTSDRIIGKIVCVLPVISQINHIFKSHFGFFFFVFCPLVLILFFEIFKTIIYIRIEDNKLLSDEEIDKISGEKDELPIIIETVDVKKEEINFDDELI